MTEHGADGGEWADPAAFGLAPLAGINLAFAGEFLGWWGPDAAVLVAATGFVGGIGQLLTGLLSMRRGDAAGGTLMATFGLLFMWGPALMLTLEAVGVVSGIQPFFGAWSVFLGVLLGMWSLALLDRPWFEFLVGPLGFGALTAAGLHDLVGLPAVVAGAGFLALLAWGLYMLAHALGAASGITVPLGRPAVELLGGASAGEGDPQYARGD